MSAFASLVLADSVPANITFVPSSIDGNGVANWFKSGSVFDARPHASLSVKLPSSTGSVARVKAKVVIPVMDTTDATKKVAECIASIEFVLPKQATSTNRLDMKAFAKNFCDNAVMTAAVDGLESIY